MNKQWKVKAIRIDYRNYGEHEGRYLGSIVFYQDTKDTFYNEFTFALTPDMTDKYLKIIADELVNNANNLSSDLLNSLGLENNAK